MSIIWGEQKQSTMEQQHTLQEQSNPFQEQKQMDSIQKTEFKKQNIAPSEFLGLIGLSIQELHELMNNHVTTLLETVEQQSTKIEELER